MAPAEIVAGAAQQRGMSYAEPAGFTLTTNASWPPLGLALIRRWACREGECGARGANHVSAAGRVHGDVLDLIQV